MAAKVAIKVDHVSKNFKLPHDRVNSLKGALIRRLRNGRQSYEVQHALDNVSFEIKEGDFFGIVGRNGSGKSTLLKMLAGIYTPSTGNIQINGRLTPFIELGVGFNPELTGRENVFLNGALLGFNRKEMHIMYGDIVAFAELEKFMDQKLKNYSSGMQVRLAFSIAIRARTDILLLDEVLAVGDAAFQRKCFEYFEELKAQHKTVVFVSHDMSSVMRFCNRAVYINDGKLLHDGTPTEVAELYVEANMAPTQARDVDEKVAIAPYSISAALTQPSRDSVEIDFKYVSPGATKMYIGISVFKDGVSVAELTTDPFKPIMGNGTMALTIDTAPLNGGVYHVGAVLFKAPTQELLAVYPRQEQFLVKGTDIMHGGALKLVDTWRQK